MVGFARNRWTVAYKEQFGTAGLYRWISGFCLALVLIFTAVESVHVHSDRALSRDSSTPCLICISAHANVPTVAAHPLPVSFVVAATVVPYEAQIRGITSRLELFTRPPPAWPLLRHSGSSY